MKVCILGAGPAGLYLSYLLKKRDRSIQVRLLEQNPPDATFGFGVVFSDRALEFLNEDDPETCSAITAHLERWQDITIRLPGEVITIDGIGFAAIGRLHLLTILQARARSVGVEPVYRHTVTSFDELSAADLIVAADGANSLVRRHFAKEFGAEVTTLHNRFAWFGTTKHFETLTQTFKKVGAGNFNAHHYRYSPEMSTFIVEADEATFFNEGLDKLDEDQSAAFCQKVFAEELDGHTLIKNRSVWRQFPKIWNDRWSHKNIVLVGDALRTAHFSIGSGTRLAMEDVIALDKALAKHADVQAALRHYEAMRRPIVEKLVAGANASAEWYEDFGEHMKRPPLDFAMDYITRSGRIPLERLRAVSPKFVSRYQEYAGK